MRCWDLEIESVQSDVGTFSLSFYSDQKSKISAPANILYSAVIFTNKNEITAVLCAAGTRKSQTVQSNVRTTLSFFLVWSFFFCVCARACWAGVGVVEDVSCFFLSLSSRYSCNICSYTNKHVHTTHAHPTHTTRTQLNLQLHVDWAEVEYPP